MYVRTLAAYMSQKDDQYTVETTQLSLQILDVVSDADGIGLRDIQSQLDIAKSTAHKHLQTLQANGLLTKRGETYHVGLKCLNLGEEARGRWPGSPHIDEAIRTLTERTEEECDFVAPDRGRIITIAESYHKWAKYNESRRGGGSKVYRARTGSYYRMHATASGLAILAAYPRDRVEEIIDQWGLPGRTEYTITDREQLYDELTTIQDRGYAIDNQSYTEGMRSVGKAVYGPGEQVIGALSVSGPTYRVDGMVLEEEIPNALVDVVSELEAKLGQAM
jgi:DNA-binding IclR family transcriptional regulator